MSRISDKVSLLYFFFISPNDENRNNGTLFGRPGRGNEEFGTPLKIVRLMLQSPNFTETWRTLGSWEDNHLALNRVLNRLAKIYQRSANAIPHSIKISCLCVHSENENGSRLHKRFFLYGVRSHMWVCTDRRNLQLLDSSHIPHFLVTPDWLSS